MALARSTSHLIVIPSYNSGPMLGATVATVLAEWEPVLVVIDASTDGSSGSLDRLIEDSGGGLERVELSENSGKGGAVLEGMRLADERGFTHVMVMDADGQHSVEAIAPFMRASFRHPEAMILGVPMFGPDAPRERVNGRRVGNWFANLETLWGGVNDSLFGFRIYPVGESLRIMEAIRTARRFDFDTELAVRLFWSGVPPINIPVPVRYPRPAEGGVSHFRYIRDNLLLARTHIRLIFGMIRRLPRLLARRFGGTRPGR